MDVVSLSQHYAQMARDLRLFMPSTCRFLNSEDIKPVGSHPVAAGGLADIWEATHDGRKIALKSYRCYENFDLARVIERFYNEIRVCSLLQHRDANTVPFVGVHPTVAHPFALVHECMDGLDLKQYLRNDPNARKLKLLTDIAQGLSHMENLGIIHGSLKATNILVDDEGIPHIAGLGNAYILPRSTVLAFESEVNIDRLRSRVGLAGSGLSPNLTDSTQPTKASDMYYDFDVMDFEILKGRPPFFELSGVAARNAMLMGHRPPRPNHHEFSDSLWYMVERCWRIEPSQRMSIGEAVNLLETELQRTSYS